MRTIRPPAFRLRAAATSVAAGGLAVLVVAPAGSQNRSTYAECSYSKANGVLRVQVNDEEGLVRRRGRRILVRVPTGTSRRYETVRCRGGRATVRNTDLIRIRVLSVGDTQGRLSLAGGPLAPGLTPESDDSPEIEVVASVTDEGDELALEGTTGIDHLRGGRVGQLNEVNLNAATEAKSPDPDLRLRRTGQATVAFSTGAGRDVVDLSGGPEFGGPFEFDGFIGASLGTGADRYTASRAPSFVRGAKGDDAIATGRDGDLVFAGSGNDRVRTGPRGDVVLLDLGHDWVSSGRGRDTVEAIDGRRDQLDCGPGRDTVFADRRDELMSCERVKYSARGKPG